MSLVDPSIWAAIGSGGLGLLAGVSLVRRRRTHDAASPTGATLTPPAVQSGTPFRATALTATLELEEAIRRLHAWSGEIAEHPDVWPAFDQVVREVLTTVLSAERVRCFRACPGASRLELLSARPQETQDMTPMEDSPLLRYVAARGRSYCVADPSLGALVHELAGQDEVAWQWVWPVRLAGDTLGLVAVRGIAPDALTALAALETLGQLITCHWRHVDCWQRMHNAEHTDRASGVLTRNDFFMLADAALADSYREHEPVVLALLTVEGLRRLDDRGRWQERDALIEQIGPAILQRTRSDDLVGRFADERFAVLLRRLDGGLGRLIATKVLGSCQEGLDRLPAAHECVTLRIGLAESGGATPTLQELLSQACNAADAARHQQCSVLLAGEATS